MVDGCPVVWTVGGMLPLEFVDACLAELPDGTAWVSVAFPGVLQVSPEVRPHVVDIAGRFGLRVSSDSRYSCTIEGLTGVGPAGGWSQETVRVSAGWLPVRDVAVGYAVALLSLADRITLLDSQPDGNGPGSTRAKALGELLWDVGARASTVVLAGNFGDPIPVRAPVAVTLAALIEDAGVLTGSVDDLAMQGALSMLPLRHLVATAQALDAG